MGAALSDPARSLARRAGVPAHEVLLVPVPITPARRRERGFNQARLLADALSEALGATLMELLERRRARPSQAHLQRRERLANAPGSYRAGVHVRQGEDESRRSVLLVDDVVTTGATAAACVTTLAAAGWRPIGLVSFARAWRSFEPSGDSSPSM